MTGVRITRRFFEYPFVYVAMSIIAIFLCSQPAAAVIVLSDGFGDADRDNDGVIEFYDTDLNDSGTWNDYDLMAMTGDDYGLASRGIFEVTAAQDPSDVGIVWSGIRSYDTTANIPKARVRIINDNVATGTETAANIHNDGLALGVETRGGGSPFIGRFPQSIGLGPEAGDKVVVSVDFRAWKEADNAMAYPAIGELRWGLFQDTDDELGTTAPYGEGFVSAPPGETVEWGKDDGNWFASQPGAEGDKGIYARLTFGDFASSFDSRLNWEYNLNGINGTANNGRILEGNGVTDTPGSGGDVGTIANPTNPSDGSGGIIHGSTFAPHTLSLEIVRLADGRIEVASFVDGVEALRDDIKEDDTGYGVLGPPAFSYDYVAFRPTTDFDYVIDNFKLEVFNTDTDLDGDFNGDGSVNAADYVAWRKNGLPEGDYQLWVENFGETSAPGSGGAAGVPEPSGLVFAIAGALLSVCAKRRNRPISCV
jgi:hypothetical protein